MCSAILQHCLELRSVSGARGFSVSEGLQNGQAITLATIFNLARLSGQVVGLCFLRSSGDTDVENSTGHATSISGRAVFCRGFPQGCPRVAEATRFGSEVLGFQLGISQRG